MDLISAIYAGDEKTVLKKLMAGADVMECDDGDLITPLHHAVCTSSFNIVSMLLYFGADPHACSNKCKESPLERANSLGRLNLVRLMNDSGSRRTLH